MCLFLLLSKNLTNGAMMSVRAFWRVSITRLLLTQICNFFFGTCFSMPVINVSLREDRGKTVLRALISDFRFLHEAKPSGKERRKASRCLSVGLGK